MTRSGAGGGTNGGGNGGGSINSSDGPPEAGCIQLSSDPTNTYPVFHNTCSFAVTYFWTPFTTPPGGYAQQNGILQPGETQKGEETAVGGYRVYACQTNYLVRGPDGSPITGVVNGYRCVKPQHMQASPSHFRIVEGVNVPRSLFLARGHRIGQSNCSSYDCQRQKQTRCG